MNNLHQPDDADVRLRALEPQGSFLIQAPAGSGKTELLIQRFLRLLAVVDEPEEILAITFTRKAASEMRKRIEAALANARAGVPPPEAHLALGYRLARTVIERDQQRDWGLAEQSSRLRISTIDAVNTRLSRRVPLSTGFTAHNSVLDDTGPLYREAARATLAFAAETDDTGRAVATLLAHCDNRAETVEKLLTSMLGRRDQWMRRTGSGHVEDGRALREWLEANLGQLVETFIRAAADNFPAAESAELLACMAHAGEAVAEADPGSPIRAWHEQTRMPGGSVTDLPLWRGLAAAMLTNEGGWRVAPNKKQGFPVGDPERKEMKTRFCDLLQRLAGHEAFREALSDTASLPDPHYPDSQWDVLLSLLRILPLTIANLKNLFAERGQTDFTEVAQEALAALGDEDEASELRLALDYQIKHILLDEFQDTSRSQYELIRLLTQGWESEPDRSLFLVGDPMQSIYSFREAEVGLFLNTKANGIGGVHPEFLQLATNFRSEAAIIEWFNRVFAELLPKSEQPVIGAVPFAHSKPFVKRSPDSRVDWHPVPAGDPEAEARRVVEIVGAANEQSHSVGILVRSRSHATHIAEKLREANIEFSAPDLERMHEQPVVHDLLALTRALTHAGDRLAWLACLRAPWCGLALADLHALAVPNRDAAIWSQLADDGVLSGLSRDGRERLARCIPALAFGLQRRGGVSLRDLVESVWQQLGGPAAAREEGDLELAENFFAFLGTLEVPADCIDGAELLQRLSERSITRRSCDTRVQIMTMHKAKGLEFDCVILPGLGSRTRSSDKPLVLFHELARSDDSEPMVIAPIKAGDQDADAIYDLLWHFEQRKEALEQDRLLYVAATRAKQQLHLFAQLDLDDDEDVRPPASNTLLARLWSVVSDDVRAAIAVGGGSKLSPRPAATPGIRTPIWKEVMIRRLSLDWSAPPPRKSCGVFEYERDEEAGRDVEFEWATQGSKLVGTIVHRWLQHIAEDGIDHWDSVRIAALEPLLRRALRGLGMSGGQLHSAASSAIRALQNTLEDERGRWILMNHDEAANELQITTDEDFAYRKQVIDRTFVTADGVRWIIDYKTGRHLGGDLPAFLASESRRYRSQLRGYRDAMKALDNRPVQTALYFPLLQEFHEVDCDASE